MVANFGPGYLPPGRDAMRTTMLDKVYADLMVRQAKFMPEWECFGGAIVSDGWTSTSHQPLVNTLMVANGKPYFIDAANTTGATKDANYIFEVLKAAVIKVGRQNVTVVITDSAPVCVAASRLLCHE